MRDKIYAVIVIILSCIAVLLLMWTLLKLSQKHMVDCGAILDDQSGADFRPIPKQCEKGE